MSNKSVYPVSGVLERFHDLAIRVNGKNSMQLEQNWRGQGWDAKVGSSRGETFEKLGFTNINIDEGTIAGKPGQVSLVEIVAYPKNSAIPAFLLMTNLNRSEGRDDMLVLFADLITQDSSHPPEMLQDFQQALQEVFTGREKIYSESAERATNPELLGDAGCKCGVLTFLTHEDFSLADKLIDAALRAYEQLVTNSSTAQPTAESNEILYRHRARLVEWIIRGDFGIQVALENGIPLEVIEAYAFPPAIHY